MLFKVYRHLPRAKRVRPVMVHINYHPGAPAPPHSFAHSPCLQTLAALLISSSVCFISANGTEWPNQITGIIYSHITNVFA